MSNTCKYEKYRRWISYDSGITWSPMNEYQKGELIERDSVDCGWEPTPPTPEVEYRWVDIPLADDFYCSGTTKYYKQKMQQSEDSGSTWTDVVPPQYRIGASAESKSYDCGYAERTTSGIGCDNANKVVFIYYQVSDDHGASWTTTSSTVDSVIEYNSEDCGYVPPTPTGSPYESQYLTLRALENDVRFSIRVFYSSSFVFSLDSGASWTSLRNSGGAAIYDRGTKISGMTPTIQSGDTVMLRGELVRDDPNEGLIYIRTSGRFEVEGNIMGLIGFRPPFDNITVLSWGHDTFKDIFTGCANLVNAENLILPATTLSDTGCYANMFSGCRNLTTTPQLPATVLSQGCYQGMFNGCSSLTTAPELLATALSFNCYSSMFAGCSSLTTAPELPATNVVHYCYQRMFQGCTSLTTTPELPATTLAPYCYSNMFRSCTSLTTAQRMSASTMTDGSCEYMFYGCSNLSAITCFARRPTAWEQTRSWVQGVAASGVFTKSENTSWPSGVDGVPSGWTVYEGETRWVDLPLQEDYYCSGTTKYYKQKKQKSYDSGSTWSDVVPAEYRMGESAETQSSDCGDVPLTFRAREDGTFKFSKDGISYSLNSGTTWTELASNTNSPTISRGNTIMWKGTMTSNKYGIGTFSSTGEFDVEGNAMSLLYGDDFEGQTSLVGDYVFRNLFNGCLNLVSAENLILPATVLSQGCYSGMFAGCSSLTTVPSDLLPATVPSDYLPVTALPRYCYENMFNGCSSLTTAPELPATNLDKYCYYGMFANCTSLNYIKCLATNRDATSTAQWANGVPSSGTFIKDANTTWPMGNHSIPYGWTVIDYQP